MGFRDRLIHGFNAFIDADKDRMQSYAPFGVSYGTRPDRTRMAFGDKSILASIYNRLGLDVAAIELRHVRLNDDNQYIETIKSGLNTCLSLDANIDQAGRAFRQDIAMSLFDKGTVAIVPVETTVDPKVSAAYDIKSLRVGEIVAWFPGHVRVNLYNDKVGRKQEITLPKETVAIVENPLYAVMNDTNSTLQRLIRKLGLLDAVDEQVSSGKLDMIIQLPYVIKSEARRDQAEQRRKDIELQLKGSQYGIAYTDGTEKITQLNRPVENNMLKQVEYLTDMLYGQLGLTKEVFDGTASEQVMLNYYNRTIEPILTAISESMERTFLSKTARSQNQGIRFFRDPFKLVPMSAIADIADKFTRNEVMSSNEIRTKIGLRPSTDPKADQLVNSNMPQPALALSPSSDPNAVGPDGLPALPPGSDRSQLALEAAPVDIQAEADALVPSSLRQN